MGFNIKMFAEGPFGLSILLRFDAEAVQGLSSGLHFQGLPLSLFAKLGAAAVHRKQISARVPQEYPRRLHKSAVLHLADRTSSVSGIMRRCGRVNIRLVHRLANKMFVGVVLFWLSLFAPLLTRERKK